MTRLNPLAVSALALLAERPMHPYEMYQLMLQRREDRVVKVSAGSLYRAVERLAADGNIAESGVEREGNRPERTVYAITDAGRDALRSTLEEMLGEFVNEFPEFPLAIGEAHNLPPERVAELLDERSGAHAGVRRPPRQRASGTSRRRASPGTSCSTSTTRAPCVAAELDWLERTIAELREGELTWATPEQLAAASADPSRT